MDKLKIKADLDHKILEDLGYSYSISEAGYLSNDGATMISIDRSPYQRQVMQYKANADIEHKENINILIEHDALENIIS